MTKSKPGRKKYLRNADLALRIKLHGFDKVLEETGDRLNPVRASKIVRLLLDRYDCRESDIDKSLMDLANNKRHGHIGGMVKPPSDGEERIYKIGSTNRVGVPVIILGRRRGQHVKIRYNRDKIVITK